MGCFNMTKTTNLCSLSPFLRPFSRWTWVSRCLLKQTMVEVVVTTGAISRAKLQSNHHHQQTNSKIFTCNAQPPVSKYWRENITSYGIAYPILTWGLPTLSLATSSSWLPCGRFAMPLISPLIPVLSTQRQTICTCFYKSLG